MWESTRRQDGLVYVARAMFRKARESNKGTDFKDAFEYCEKVMDTVEAEDLSPSSALMGVAAEVYYEWLVRRRITAMSGDEIDWELLLEYSRLGSQHLPSQPIPFLAYVAALALSHMRQWQKAELIFRELRSKKIPAKVLHATRDHLHNDDGSLRQVQGEVRHNEGKVFLYVEELEWDFLVDSNDRWPNHGLSTTAYIRFSFAGPKAIKDIV